MHEIDPKVGLNGETVHVSTEKSGGNSQFLKGGKKMGISDTSEILKTKNGGNGGKDNMRNHWKSRGQ